jgi:ribosomal protein S3
VARETRDPRLMGIAEAIRKKLGRDVMFRRAVYRYLLKAPDLTYKEMLSVAERWQR